MGKLLGHDSKRKGNYHLVILPKQDDPSKAILAACTEKQLIKLAAKQLNLSKDPKKKSATDRVLRPMILAKQFDLSKGSSVTPRLNLVKELEKYNQQKQELIKQEVETESQELGDPSGLETVADNPPMPKPVPRPNILSRRPKKPNVQKSSGSASVLQASTLNATITSSHYSSGPKTTTVSPSASVGSSVFPKKAPIVSPLASVLASVFPKTTSPKEAENSKSLGIKAEDVDKKPDATVRFLSKEEAPVSAAAVLSIPTPAFLAKKRPSETSVTSSVQSRPSVPPVDVFPPSDRVPTSDIVSKSVSSVIPSAPIISTITVASSSSVNPIKKLTQTGFIHPQSNIVIGNVLKSGIIQDPTTLPVLMPVSTDRMFPACPDDVVLPAGKGYVVFKPMGNLPKDCIYSVEPTTGLINAVVDPSKFVKPPVTKAFTGSDTTSSQTKVWDTPRLNPAVAHMLNTTKQSEPPLEVSLANNESFAKFPWTYKEPYLKVQKKYTVVNPDTKKVLKSHLSQPHLTSQQMPTLETRVPNIIISVNASNFTDTPAQSTSMSSDVTSNSKTVSTVVHPGVVKVTLPFNFKGNVEPRRKALKPSERHVPPSQLNPNPYQSVGDPATGDKLPGTPGGMLKTIFTNPTENLRKEQMTLNQLVRRSKTLKSLPFSSSPALNSQAKFESHTDTTQSTGFSEVKDHNRVSTELSEVKGNTELKEVKDEIFPRGFSEVTGDALSTGSTEVKGQGSDQVNSMPSAGEKGKYTKNQKSPKTTTVYKVFPGEQCSLHVQIEKIENVKSQVTEQPAVP